MSKNVAVFVDVANIFYAAKTAGVDIDYVTLLQSATAGRDFVRAYAYTGLDPENENQKNFHKFLSDRGYKVVSKDIRKYGDGRIKANLDIELVVDMMRMATHIDIAVVVSGDGDFAPAIRAVQQMGVRVEVISFRGNTSSDLMDVADTFINITDIARVERGVRSGRRVAADDDDLSMTEVPDKETDLGPRRRRGGRRPEREERPALRPLAPSAASNGADIGLPGNIIVLPGERLSRAPDAEDEPELEVVADGAEPGAEAETEEGRRRRRRRGGRGRGRGRRPEGEAIAGEVAGGDALSEATGTDEDELLEEEVVPLPQHSTFGSVWDSQMGVPVSPTGGGSFDEDADEDEPEIPEYLLAERRAQGRGGNNRGRNNRPGRAPGGYQSAVDRERYGRSPGASGGSYGAGNRLPDRPRGGQGGQRPAGGRSAQPPRGPRPLMNEPRRDVIRPVDSAEPWSEVPPEVQELLRQEQARRQGAPRAAMAEQQPAGIAPNDVSTTGRPRRTRSSASVEVAAIADAAPVADAAPAPRRRTTRVTAAATAPAAVPAETAAPVRRTRARATAAPSAAVAAAPADVPATPVAPARRTRAKVALPADAAVEPAASDTASAAKPRRRTTRSTGDTTEG